MSDRWTKQAEMLANRIRKNEKSLSKWRRKESISCYRSYDRDIPEIPLAIDVYEGRLHVAEYARRTTRDLSDEQRRSWLELLTVRAADQLEVDRDLVFIKRRERQRGATQYERFDRRGAVFIVHEGGLRFRVNLSDYLDTGLFLDHRTTRARVRGEAEGRRVLNLFAYTGSFSVYAADGGARSTTTVDLSATYLDWARENFALNEVTRDRERHQLIRADARRFLEEGAEQGRRWDLIIVDPPSFSNSKRVEEDFDLQRHHGELLRSTLSVLAPGGVIYFSTNLRKFRIDQEALMGVEVENVTEESIPRDYRDRRIHSCYRLTRRRRRVVGSGGASGGGG